MALLSYGKSLSSVNGTRDASDPVLSRRSRPEPFAKRYGAVIPPEVIAGFPVKEAFDVFCKALEHSQPQVRLAAAQGMNMIVDELEHPESCRDVLEWFESGWPGRHHLTFEKRPAEKSGALRKLLREASSRLYHRHQLEEFDEEHLPKEEGGAP